MPELPEVRAHAARLDAGYRGKLLAGFRPISFTALKTFDPDPAGAVGSPLTAIRSRGKHLLIEVAPLTFVVHLMQGGRLEPDPKESAKPRGGLARWRFEEAPALLLTEAGKEHRAGVWVRAGSPEGQEPLDGLGPEADEVDRAELARLLARGSGRLHGFLRDQRNLAGIGRRLANEICHTARLSPFATTSKLDDDEIDRLHAAIASEIAASLAFESGQEKMVASRHRPAQVHHREGEECPVCSDLVRAVEYRAYTVNYCATCQTGGKVLADNTTSKFLR